MTAENTKDSAADIPRHYALEMGAWALILGPAPVAVAILSLGLDWRWAGLGALAWVLGMVVKIPVGGAVYFSVNDLATKPRAAILGLVSAAAELVVAGAIFELHRSPATGLSEILLFALAAGATENVVLYVAAAFQKPTDQTLSDWAGGAKESWVVRHTWAVERGIALTGHLAARSLVCIAVLFGHPLLAGIAALTFSAVDGLAAYGEAEGWNWSDPKRCKRFFGWLSLASVIELGVLGLAIIWLF